MKKDAVTAHSKILILDFGSQYTQVIARRVRECQVYSEIVRFDITAAEVAELAAKGHHSFRRSGQCLRRSARRKSIPRSSR